MAAFETRGETVMVVGDSFVVRLQDHVLSADPPQVPACPLQDHNSRVLKAPPAISKVFFYGVGGTGVLDLNKKLHIPKDLILSLSPKFVILEIGGNDIDSPSSTSYDVAHSKIDMAKQILTLGVDCVVLTTILPRDNTRHIPASQFRDKATGANEWTSHLLTNDPAQKSIQFHRHKGFWRDASRNEVDTSGWSTDGVHPNKPSGLEKLRRSYTQILHNMVKTHRNLQSE